MALLHSCLLVSLQASAWLASLCLQCRCSCLVESQLCLLCVFSARPAIDESSSKEGKRRMVHQRKEKTEIPACKDHQRVEQVQDSLFSSVSQCIAAQYLPLVPHHQHKSVSCQSLHDKEHGESVGRKRLLACAPRIHFNAVSSRKLQSGGFGTQHGSSSSLDIKLTPCTACLCPQEVCYLCLQQEKRCLRTAMLEEKEKKAGQDGSPDPGSGILAPPVVVLLCSAGLWAQGCPGYRCIFP